MSSNTGRADRRRRILNDGVRAAGVDSTPHAASNEPSDVSRYGANEDSVSFAIARRVLPHRRRAILGVAAAGVLGVAALLACHHYQSNITATLGVERLPAIDLASPNSIASWASTVAMIAVASLCLLVFGLRRRRADDLRGLYRWWMTAAIAIVACGVCTATGLHQSLAEVAAAQTGWHPMGGSTLWWAVPATLALGAIVLRTLLDLKHCTPALTGVIATIMFAIASAAPGWGWLPESATPWSAHIAHGGVLLGMLSAATTLLCYSRRIVLEADGAIKAPVQKPTPKPEKKVAEPAVTRTNAASRKSAKTSTPTQTPRIAASTTDVEPKQSAKKKPVERVKASTTQWTDGSDGVSDYDDDGEPRRKLSKAERKRLRKQKARQGRAA